MEGMNRDRVPSSPFVEDDWADRSFGDVRDRLIKKSDGPVKTFESWCECWSLIVREREMRSGREPQARRSLSFLGIVFSGAILSQVHVNCILT